MGSGPVPPPACQVLLTGHAADPQHDPSTLQLRLHMVIVRAGLAGMQRAPQCLGMEAIMDNGCWNYY